MLECVFVDKKYIIFCDFCKKRKYFLLNNSLKPLQIFSGALFAIFARNRNKFEFEVENSIQFSKWFGSSIQNQIIKKMFFSFSTFMHSNSLFTLPYILVKFWGFRVLEKKSSNFGMSDLDFWLDWTYNSSKNIVKVEIFDSNLYSRIAPFF